MPSPSESEEKRSAPPNSFPQYAPPHINPGAPSVVDAKFHKPLFSLARQMMKKVPKVGKQGIKTNQTVHFSHKRSKKRPKFW